MVGLSGISMFLSRRRTLHLVGLFLMVVSLMCLVVWITNMEGRYEFLASKLGFQDNTEMISKHKERRLRIEKYCAKYGENRAKKKLDLSNLIVVEKYKMVYCSVPKVACTVWKRILANLEGLNITRGVHKNTKGKLKLLQNYSLKKRQEILQTFTKFMFVREPFERLLSAYRDCFWGPFKRRQDSWKSYRKQIRNVLKQSGMPIDLEADNTTFAQFAKYLILRSRESLRFQEHWRQQHELCSPCQVHYDVIGHYETFEEDARFILRKSGTEWEVSLPSWKPTDTNALLQQYYSNLTMLRLTQLERIYKKDFDLFGYSYPGPLESVIEGFQNSRL